MITLDGRTLGIAALMRAARGELVELAPEGRARMRAGRAVIDRAVAEGVPIYGVTRGLGARSGETLDGPTLAAFSVQTLRGRAQATGAPERPEIVRAAMIVRLNTLLSGLSGASEAVADSLLACLNAGLVPVVGRIGSIGPSDLVQNATMGLALTGEGRLSDGPETGDAAVMLERKGLRPLAPGPRDGLALAGHCGFTVGAAAVAFDRLETAFAAAQTAAALTLEAFRANLSPLRPEALAAKPLPGQQRAAADLVRRLDGSALWQPDAARRLQDPLSLRHVAQIHGGLRFALDQATDILAIELNGASDNPVVITETAEVVPTGAYYCAELGLVCETALRALLAVAMAQAARLARMLDPRFSDLPVFLARPDSGSNGFAPLMKTAEALVAEIAHAAQPPAIWPSLNAGGVEDTLSTAPVAARQLDRAAEAWVTLIALEFLIAVRGIELRGCAPAIAPILQGAMATCRALSPLSDEDRPLTGDLDALSAAILAGDFA